MSGERRHRGTIHLEDAAIVAVTALPATQYVVTLRAPKTAAAARPGSFVHVTCDPGLPMRRPLSIMRADPAGGCIDVLFKTVGEGLSALASRQPGESVSLLGPIGRPFSLHRERPRPLLLGGGVGIPPMVFLAEAIRRDETLRARYRPFVVMGSEIPFPFEPVAAGDAVAGIPAGVDATMPELEALAVPARLASLSGFPGCHRGFVTDLAELWLAALTPAELAEVELFACGPTPMLAAVAALARRHRLPCQVSLEEYMACAVGGCAGCTVRVQDENGVAMKRVCVDGPVFDAYGVFPADKNEAAAGTILL
ncbi:MAG: dihydroorotate dehydrogenase electron transfer subunit [Pseudomonadota bacterium]